MGRFVLAFTVCGLILSSVGCSPSDSDGDSKEPDAAKVVIQNTGSDTMVNLAQTWAEEYKTVKPDISIEVAGGGSGVGISNLRQGTVDIANASRKLKDTEAVQVKQNTGKEAKEFVVAHDGIGIYVHKDNPIESITLEQLGQIYGKNATITKWSQLGVNHADLCGSDEIVCFSRQSNSGTYQFFRDAVLKKGDFRLGTRDLHGSKDVVDAIGNTACGIGYSGMGYKTDAVKFVKVSKVADGTPFEPTIENVLSGDYPIARPLQMYTLGDPTGAIKEYIDWIYSTAGQTIVKDNGYVPLAAN